MSDTPDPLVDLLADHDAGLPVDPSVLTHPRARAVLDALAATRAELAAVPPVPVPPALAARWSAALELPRRVDRSDTASSPVPCGGGPDGSNAGAREPDHSPTAGGAAGADRTVPAARHQSVTGPAAPSTGPAGAGPRPSGTPPPRGPGRTRRLLAPRPAVVAGLVLVLVLVVGGVVSVRRAPPPVTAAQLGGIARAAVGVRDAGPFSDPARLEACLRTVAPPGLAPDAALAGGREVVFEGRPGFVLLLITGKLATFRVLVVEPDCGAGRGRLLGDIVVP